MKSFTHPSGQGPLPSPESDAAASLTRLGEEYFAFLAREFPTLCLHDEFIFFPRVARAWDHWFQAPRLEEAALQTAGGRLRDFLARLDELRPRLEEPESLADAVLLQQSLHSVLRELGEDGPWTWDPFLYLKAASLAWAPVLAQAPHLNWQNEAPLAELLAQAAQLLAWGGRQVRHLTRPARLLSTRVFADAHRFVTEILPAFLEANFPARSSWRAPAAHLARELERFREKMDHLPASRPFHRGEAGLERMLTESWGWQGGMERAEVLLAEESRESKDALKHLARHHHLAPSWTAALMDPPTPPDPDLDLLALYRREVARLWAFWGQSPLLPPPQGRVLVAETPVYLRALRSSASYAAPWGRPEEHPGYFYVTPEIEDAGHHLRHYRFLSAHETVPGHHYLDARRLSLGSPVRRQYESPLYYEGWACYAETLLISAGYLTDPRDRLTGWQRRYWRALRGLVDLELQSGRTDLDRGLARLRQAGYPEATARRQILQLAHNPGYQLCYTLGLREILRLQARFAPTLGLARFHETLTAGGQLPFGLLKQRLKDISRKDAKAQRRKE